MKVVNYKAATNTIININKIEETIKMQKIIQFTTSKNITNSIQTINIPTDLSISWNNMKVNKNVKFKTIDNPIRIEELVADRNVHHLNQTRG